MTVKNPRPGFPRSSRKLAFESLEPRALLSADLLPVAELPGPAAPVPAEFRDTAAVTPAAPVVQLGAESPRELVIVDAGVDGATALADEWAARGFEVVVLDPARDALDQIGALLGERRGLAAVHLVSHGTQGSLQLGGTTLGAAELSARAADVARWADAFAADGDLLLYGCDVAGSAVGGAFVERLALLTGADVAASTDATGSGLLGGDWDPEHLHGVITSDFLEPTGWSGLLSQSITWGSVTWTAGDLAVDIPIGTLGDVSVTVIGDTGRLEATSPSIDATLQGGLGGTAGSSLSLDSVGGSTPGFAFAESVDLRFDFSALPGEVTNLSFYVFDIDVASGGNGFIDRVTVTANDGTLDPTTITGTNITNSVTSLNTITGIGTSNSPNPSGDGNGFFAFAQLGITSFTLNYGNANALDQSRQGIGVNTITFDIAPVNLRPVSVIAAEDTTIAFSDGNLISVADDDANLVTLSVSSGTLALTASGGAVLAGSGATRTVSGSLADINATLATLVYTPNANFNGADTLSIVSTDGTYSDSDSVAITVSPVNDAPVLDAARSPVLAAVSEGAGAPSGAVGTLVANLVDFASPAGQVDNVADPDPGAQPGIALVGVDASQGSWFYSLNGGGTWLAVPAVSGSNALLLAADADTRLYFQPNPTYDGTLASAITFRAWDRTAHVEGALVNPGAGGGTSAFSAVADTASLVVIAVNDAPVIGSLAGDARSYAAGTGAVVVDQGTAATITDIDSPDFAGGSLVVTIVAGEVAAEDVLAIATGPTVSLSAGMTVGGTVSVGGVAVGTITANGVGGADLAVSLNANATAARVTTLLQAVTYANTDAGSPTPGSRTLRFTLSDGDGGTSAPADATVTVKPVVSIAATDASAAEPGDGGRFTVSLGAASATDTEITFTIAGTAANGTDYTLIASPVTILAGATTGFIDVGVIDDLIVEDAETVTVTLNAVSAGDPDVRIDGAASGATVTIAESDTVTLTIADASVNEGAGTITFAVTADRAVAGGFSIDVLFGGGSATGGVDYDAAPQTVAFTGTAGEVRTVTVAVFDDSVVETDETFIASLGNVVPVSAPAASLVFADTAIGTLADDDGAPTLADATVAAPENSPVATLLIDLSDTLTGTDADPDGDPIGYAILAGNGAGAFTLDAATGILTVANAMPLDFETTPVFVLTVLATDGTNTDTATLTIDLSNANEAPTVGAPAAGDVAEDQIAAFSVANGNAIVIADVDAATLQVTLTSTNGVLSLASVAGLAFSSGDGTADATMTFSGGISAINAALDGLGYAPGANFNGPALVSLLVDDLGQSGSGGPRTASASIAMTVTPANDAPTIAGDLALLVLEGQAVTVLSADLLGVDVDDAGTGLVYEVITAPGRGRVEFADAPGTAIASFTQADLDVARVRYVHDGSETTADAFSLRLSDGGEDGAAPALGTLTVVVVPANDAPVLITGNGSVDEGARIVLSAALVSATDPDDATGTLLFSLDTVVGGFVELAESPGVPITRFTGAHLEAGLVRFVQADAAVAPAFRVTASDGRAIDGPRVVVLTLRGAGSQPQDAPPREAAPGLLTAAAFLSDSRLAEVRAPQVVAFLREPTLEPTGPTIAEPEADLPAAASTRIAGAALQTPPVELAAAGLRFAPPPPAEVTVPRIDFSFDSSRHNLEPPEGSPPLGLSAIDAVRVAGLALTAGGVWWVFRIGGLIGSALVSAPAWRHIDPLPVLGGGSRDTVEWNAADGPVPNAEADASEQYFDSGDSANSPSG